MFFRIKLNIINFDLFMSLQSLEIQNILLIILSVLVFLLIIQNFFLRKRYKKIFKKNDEHSIENVLSEYLSRTEKTERNIKKLMNDLIKLEKHSESLVRRTLIKRYNPFKDSGSDQSFTISLLDGTNNGLLLTGLYSRDGVRVYAKPVENGLTKHGLSNEEAEILKKSILLNKKD